MTKTNSKKALLSSAFALVVSVAMLIGTTFCVVHRDRIHRCQQDSGG